MYYAPTPPPPHIAGRSSAAASTLRVGVPFANELHQQNAADLRFTRDNLREYVHLCRIGDAQKGLEVILRVSTSWWELLVLVVLVVSYQVHLFGIPDKKLLVLVVVKKTRVW